MYEGSLQDLIDALGRLPGVGPKSAQRLAFLLISKAQPSQLAPLDLPLWPIWIVQLQLASLIRALAA